jgi:hypothetical protein
VDHWSLAVNSNNKVTIAVPGGIEAIISATYMAEIIASIPPATAVASARHSKKERSTECQRLWSLAVNSNSDSLSRSLSTSVQPSGCPSNQPSSSGEPVTVLRTLLLRVPDPLAVRRANLVQVACPLMTEPKKSRQLPMST